MANYAGVHSRSYTLVMKKGESVTFTKQDLDYVASSDVSTVSTSSVAGVAVQDKGGSSLASGSLSTSKGLVLYFVPQTIGDEPTQGSTCTWAGVDYSVSSVESVAPDGTVIGSYVELK